MQLNILKMKSAVSTLPVYSPTLEFLRKLLIDGFLREMDCEMNGDQSNIILPKQIYEQCLKYFPRFESNDMLLLDPSLSNLDLYVAGCYLSDPPQSNIIFTCTQKLRKILSIEQNPPIDQIIAYEIVPKFIEFLSSHYNKFWELQFEAAWALTNICSGTKHHVHHVINNPQNPEAIALFIQLLNSENISLKEQSIWALGNICGDSPQCRNIVLSKDILSHLIPLIQSMCNEVAIKPFNFTQEKAALLRNATWALSNLCRGKPSPDVKYIVSMIPVLNTLLSIEDTEVIMDTLWSYSYLTEEPCRVPSHYFENRKNPNVPNQIGEGPPSQNNARMDVIHDGPDMNMIEEKTNEEDHRTILDFIFECDGVINRFMHLLDSESPHIVHPALRILGNICTSKDSDTQRILDCGILSQLHKLLTAHSTRDPIKREALWTISNITAGNDEQIQRVIDRKLISVINDMILNTTYNLAKEAVWSIANALSSANERQMDHMVIKERVVPNLCQFMQRMIDTLKQTQATNGDEDDDDNKQKDALRPDTTSTSILVAIEGLQNVLKVGNRKYVLYTEQHGLLKHMEALLPLNISMQLDNEIVTRCADIIATYFKEAPSQIIYLLQSPNASDRKQCCLMLRDQLNTGSIYHCRRIIECENMVTCLLMNLKSIKYKNDVKMRNDVVWIISDLFIKLDASLTFLQQSEDIMNTKKILLFLIDASVILPFVDFLLYLLKNQEDTNEIDVGETIWITMQIIEMILKYKSDASKTEDDALELTKFYMIKYDAVYAMKLIINDKNMLHSIRHSQEIIDISSNVMKKYFKFNTNKYPNYEKKLVCGYFRQLRESLVNDTENAMDIVEICCYYGYDYNFEQNKRRSSIIIESQSLLQNSVSDLAQFDFDDVLLDLDFGM